MYIVRDRRHSWIHWLQTLEKAPNAVASVAAKAPEEVSKKA